MEPTTRVERQRSDTSRPPSADCPLRPQDYALGSSPLGTCSARIATAAAKRTPTTNATPQRPRAIAAAISTIAIPSLNYAPWSRVELRFACVAGTRVLGAPSQKVLMANCGRRSMNATCQTKQPASDVGTWDWFGSKRSSRAGAHIARSTAGNAITRGRWPRTAEPGLPLTRPRTGRDPCDRAESKARAALHRRPGTVVGV